MSYILSGLKKEHPFRFYLDAALAQMRGDGHPNPAILADDINILINTPLIYPELKLDAIWMGNDSWTNGKTHTEFKTCDRGCGCPDDLETEEKVDNVIEEPEEWVGSLTIDFEDKKIRVLGLVFEYGDRSMYHQYFLTAPDLETGQRFMAHLKNERRKQKKAFSYTHILVNDSAGIRRPKMDWGDVILEDGFQEKIQRNIDAFFKAKDLYKKHRLAYRRGILMVGPPGNGKTSCIRILAALYPQYAFFMYGFGGNGMSDPERLRRLFKKASNYSPAIIVLEDLDRVAHDGAMRAILNIMDGLTSSDGVFVLATSNNAAQIDPALIERPSRFDLVMRFDEPKIKQRAEYLTKKLGHLGTPEQLEKLVNSTNGYSMAMLQELLTGALLESVLSDRKEPTWDDVLTGFKRLQDSRATARKEIGKKDTKVGFSDHSIRSQLPWED